uniref:Uncharacterized protein n=1 Tax=Acrobeloides nanus TaxID=290746 RepID=A0A914C5J2_9BILA
MQKSHKYQPIPTEDVEQAIKNEYTGCCICHIRKGAKIVGILGFILDFIFVIIVLANAISHSVGKDPLNARDGVTMCGVAVLSICGVIVHGLILYGLKTEQPWPFIPYLIIKPIEILGLLGAILGLSTEVITSITIISWAGDGQVPEITSLLMVLAVKIWFWSIIFKTYSYFKRNQSINLS